VAVSAPWYNGADRRGPRSNSERVPRSVFNGLSAHGAAFGPLRKRLTCLTLSCAERCVCGIAGQHVARYLLCEDGEELEIKWEPDWRARQ